MNVVCITHADFETPGVIEPWFRDRGHTFKIIKPYSGEKLSISDEFDLLVVMGGPQSPLDIEAAPYLLEEINFLKLCLEQNTPIMGFCLGAQLIAEALGSRTVRSPEKEVGVFPIRLNAEGCADDLLKRFATTFSAIHWHNDMPGLPSRAVVLASSMGCPRQIVKFKPNVYGFQCHFEITSKGIEQMIKFAPQDLSPSEYTQSFDQLINNDYKEINSLMNKILHEFVLLTLPNKI